MCKWNVLIFVSLSGWGFIKSLVETKKSDTSRDDFHIVFLYPYISIYQSYLFILIYLFVCLLCTPVSLCPSISLSLYKRFRTSLALSRINIPVGVLFLSI